jgi:hypothetical protein
MPSGRDEPLGHCVSADARQKLEELRTELRGRGCKAQYGHILEILILAADPDALEPVLPRRKRR